MEEEGMVMPLPPVVVVDEEGVVQPPPGVLVEEDVVVQPPQLVEEEGVLMPLPPVVVVDEEGVVQPPPGVVVEEDVVVQPPQLVEEEGVLMPLQPVVVVDEEGVVHPPPMLEGEEGVQEVFAPNAHELLLAQWVTTTLGQAAHYRHLVATGVEYVISRCETARATLHEVAAVLLQDPIDAAETIYIDLLEAVSRGMDSFLLGPAANIVDSLFNWPGPLAGAIDVARVLVHDTFYYREPEGTHQGRPLEEARRALVYLVDVVHAEAGDRFNYYAENLGHDALPGGPAAYDLWELDHLLADALAREALQILNVAVERSLAADLAVRLCGIVPASRVRPGAGPLVRSAAGRLQQTVIAVENALTTLQDMRDTLVEVEQSVLNVTGGQDPDPPPPP